MRLSFSFLLSAAALLPSAPLAAQQQAATASAPSRDVLVPRLDSLVRGFLTEAPAAGATVAVVRGADTLLLEGVGERDRTRHLLATTTTVYRIGSITKQFTASAIMRLVEQGKISLGDPLTKYLPQYSQWSRVTIRQLLNHTSGIHSYTAVPDWQRRWADDLTPDTVVAIVARDTFDFASGAQWRYNNTGYFLLGMILETVTRRPYADYLREQFFAPLGMRSAEYCPSRPVGDQYAAGYDLDRGTIVPTKYLSMTHPYAAGALCMSVPDFLRWQTALTSGRVVGPATYLLMSSSDTINSGLKTGYGFGLAAGRLGSHPSVQHGGGINGFSTQQLWFPEDSLRIVVFTNTLGSEPERLATNLAAAVFGLPFERKAVLPPAVALAASDRAKYEGTYDIALPTGRTLPLRVFVDADGLAAQAEGPGQGKMALRYLGADTFGATFDPSLRLTILFAEGRAVKAQLKQRGATMEGARRP